MGRDRAERTLSTAGAPHARPADAVLWAWLRHVDQAWADSTPVERVARVTAARALFGHVHPQFSGTDAAASHPAPSGAAYRALATTVAVALGPEPPAATVHALWEASVDADRLRAAAVAPPPALAPVADALALAVTHL